MNEGLPIRMRCAGCGSEPLPFEAQPYPFRCPRSGRADDIDHVMRREIDAPALHWPAGTEPNPFERYRDLLYSCRFAASHGMADQAYVELVRRLDQSVAAIDGRGSISTPFRRIPLLSEQLGFTTDGGVFVKDETGNVSGSHKGRHLMGIMLYLRVLDELGLAPGRSGRFGDPPRPSPQPPVPSPQSLAPSPRPLVPSPRPLSIASCGNAALAAAIIAKAAGWPLRVFVPPSANRFVLERLKDLGAEVITCERRTGELGDPPYLRFRESLEEGALPFCVQGSDNALTIEGGETLVWEVIDVLGKAGLDRLFVQVGGGALASSCIQAFSEALALGRISRLPRFHAVQTRGGFPLKRAYDRVADRILERLRSSVGTWHWTAGRRHDAEPDGRQATSGETPDAAGGPRIPDWERAEIIRASASSPVVREELHFARTHRSAFMWPWEQEPRSIAHGILDDETYDWAVVVEGMLLTGGYPVVVDEGTLVDANTVGREATAINVDHTGSAGLAGLMQLGTTREAAPKPAERVGVIFSGIRRPAR
jgi:threonine synthase